MLTHAHMLCLYRYHVCLSHVILLTDVINTGTKKRTTEEERKSLIRMFEKAQRKWRAAAEVI